MVAAAAEAAAAAAVLLLAVTLPMKCRLATPPPASSCALTARSPVQS